MRFFYSNSFMKSRAVMQRSNLFADSCRTFCTAFESESMEESGEINMESGVYSKDFLQGFVAPNIDYCLAKNRVEDVKDDGIELTLGLSLNGRFGVDLKAVSATKLARSSSLNPSNEMSKGLTNHTFPALMRRSSLPMDPGEEVRKRKEMQSLRRMEAKRKRIEKQRKCSLPVPLAPAAKKVPNRLSSEKLRNQSLGEVLSQSSGSESESQFIQGLSKRQGVEVTSLERIGPAFSGQMKSEPNKPAGLIRAESLGTGMKNQFKRLTVSDNIGVEENVRSLMLDMPCVSTHGDGPDGKRIEGLLYQYDKGKEVRIVCVCHGSSLSPSEFVEHAGGTDVEQPLKQIIVTPAAFL